MMRAGILIGLVVCFFITGFSSSALSKVIMEDAEKKEKKEEKLWKRKLVAQINFSQFGYSNWAKGGQNAISWNTRVEGEVIRNGGMLSLDLTGIMEFGQTKQEGAKIRNSKDKIDVDCSLSWKVGSYVNPNFTFGLLTQFTTGYDYSKTPAVPKSNFFDPAYLTQSLGAKINVKNIFKSELGIGLKETITNKYNQYADNPETEEVEKYRFEEGIESKSRLNVDILNGLNVRSKLDMFSSFKHLNIIDVDWDILFTYKLNRYITVTFNTQVIYDRDVVNKTQIKEEMGLGISYSFF